MIDIKAGNPYPGGALSNFIRRPFMMDQLHIESMEGFLQSLKFSKVEKQKYICSLYGKTAKISGKGINWMHTQLLYWKEEPIHRNSEQYQQLLERAFATMFTSNEKAQRALLDTGSEPLDHSIGHNKQSQTVLTRKEFCSILTNIRECLHNQQYLEFSNDYAL